MVFAFAATLGAWQMWVRSPLHAPYSNPETFIFSVTAHGTSMAYVMTTLFVMGFGYYVAETALERALPGRIWAWLGFVLAIVGTLMALGSVLSGRASVLYTFYPPLTASPIYYVGLVLVVVGSWIWCVLMIVAMAGWKSANPGHAVPLAHFATVANAIMWLWTTVGVAAELLFLVIPAALGWTDTIDAGLSRTLYSWTLHAIVYFWLFPAYIAFYTMAPQAAGGRLYSDTMGRISFLLFIIYSVPVGIHHLFMDPEQATGFKYLQGFLTGLVTIPTLLTIFTISASFEVAGRLRGGTGRLGWLRAARQGSWTFAAVVRVLSSDPGGKCRRSQPPACALDRL
jgi:cytochrome c oxidase subunit 1